MNHCFRNWDYLIQTGTHTTHRWLMNNDNINELTLEQEKNCIKMHFYNWLTHWKLWTAFWSSKIVIKCVYYDYAINLQLIICLIVSNKISLELFHKKSKWQQTYLKQIWSFCCYLTSHTLLFYKTFFFHMFFTNSFPNFQTK